MTQYTQKIMVTGEGAGLDDIAAFAARALDISKASLARSGKQGTRIDKAFGETGVFCSLVTVAA